MGTVLLKGHLMNMCAKLSSNWGQYFKTRFIKCMACPPFLNPQQPNYSIYFNYQNNFEGEPPKKHFFEITLKLIR